MRAQVQLARPRKVFSNSFSSSASKSIIPERLTGGLSLTVPDTLSKSRSGACLLGSAVFLQNCLMSVRLMNTPQ